MSITLVDPYSLESVFNQIAAYTGNDMQKRIEAYYNCEILFMPVPFGATNEVKTEIEQMAVTGSLTIEEIYNKYKGDKFELYVLLLRGEKQESIPFERV